MGDRVLKSLLFTLSLLSLLPSAIFADSIPIFYWDNQQNFVAANHCKVSPIERNHFRFSSYVGQGSSKTENLRNYNGIRQSHLVNYSLVKLIKGRRKRNYELIEVIGVNDLKDVEPNRWFTRQGDRGYIYQLSLLPAEDYIMRLGEEAPDAPLGELKSSTEGTMWHIAFEDNYFKLSCPENSSSRDYIVFRVYSLEDKEKPIALVGVYWDETKIFRSFESLSKAEAHKFIPTILDEVHMDVLLTPSQLSREIKELSENIGEEEVPEVIEAEAPIPTPKNTEINSLEHVICVGTDNLNVRNEELTKIIFKAQQGESVKIFQGWENESKKLTIDGIHHSFIKVQFPNREAEDEKNGWVSSYYVQPKDQCKFTNNNTYTRPLENEISGLDDPACCEFPTVKRPTHSYLKGMRRFGAARSSRTKLKRKHAACDLYRYKNEPALSVAPGRVIRDKYYFYQGTYALDILHDGGFVARYGEITGRKARGIELGARVKMGDQVGYIGKVNSNCCRPMLHFELYSGEESGPLFRKDSVYRRRKDLLNPTNYLLKWEGKKF